MDRLDYTFKFSTELIVASFSLFIILANVVAGAADASATSNNLYGKLLSYHPQRNMALYSKSTTTSTVIAQENRLIPTASADVVLASSELPATDAVVTESIISDNSIDNLNPSSIRELVTSQVKVYDTVAGDSLSSVAQKFGISTDTIIWANDLKDTNIKPGWNLIILPTSGILHKVQANDTLPSIAAKFHGNTDRIIAYNGLQDINDIEPDELIIIPDGKIVAPPKAKPAIRNTVKGRLVYEPSVDDDTSIVGKAHRFPWGQCTYYVATQTKVSWGGNANQWMRNAPAFGAKIAYTPKVGSIIVTNENRRYGHVAWIIGVGNGTVTFREMNYAGLGAVTTRTLDTNDSRIKGYIYVD
jgi:surface antigen/LysM repeat protein